MADISFDVAEGYYLSPFTANMLLSDNVQSLQFSVNGAPPAISKYIAYDTLTPPNPFIAVTQDGTGNVVYDGGFPKFYNNVAPVAGINSSITMEFKATRIAGATGNTYYYDAFTDKNVTIAIGDKLVYDMFQDSVDARVGIDAITAADSHTDPATYSLRDWGWPATGSIKDQNGLAAHPSTDLGTLPVGKWYRREFDLSQCAGHTFIKWSLAYEGEVAGTFATRFRDVYILDRDGNIKATLFKDVIDLPNSSSVEAGASGYTNLSKTLYDPRSQLSASFKYLYNAINWVANPKKVAAGNRKILILGDAISTGSYPVKGTAASGFNISFTRLCAAAGFTPTFKDISDYAGSRLNPTAAELSQYTCVLLMSSQSGTTAYITDAAVQNLLAFREAGNGLIVVTDHGPVINGIAQANNTGLGGGFFWTANKLISQFGAYFSGDYNRTPVNVGFLRSTYGDHPLYAGMTNAESISAGGSESRVQVAIYPSITPAQVTPFSIGNGKSVIQVTATLKSGDIVSYKITYNVVTFKISFSDGTQIRDNGQIMDVGAKNRSLINAVLVGSLDQSVNGIIYKNGVRVGAITYSVAGGLVQTWDDSSAGAVKVQNSDKFTVIIGTPLNMTSEITIRRFQPITIRGKKDLADIMNTLRTFKPELTDIKRVGAIIDDIAASAPGLGITHLVNIPLNLKLLDNHFNNEGRTSADHIWKLESDLADLMGAKAATATGTMNYVTFGGKNALKFTPGVNAWVTINNLKFGSGPWSVNLWYNPVNFTDYHHLLSTPDNSTLVFKIGKTGDPIASAKPYVVASSFNVTGGKVGADVVPAGTWSMFTFTFTGSSLKIYVNGVLKGDFAVTMNVPLSNFKIGHNTSGSTTEQSNGYQRDLSIYSRVLTVNEILELYTSG